MTENQNLRMTRQREIILSELKKVRSHPSADEIHDMVRKRLPRISLATVYRNLEILSEFGLIKKLETAGAKKRFDGTTVDHHHVRCIVCGRMADISRRPVMKFEEALDKASGYELTGYQIEFTGVCPKCGKEDGKPH